MSIKIATYQDMASIPVKENNEFFIPVDYYNTTIQFGTGYTKSPEGATVDSFVGKIMVRKTVAEKLAQANALLKKFDARHVLYVSYGYRSLETQTKKFNEEYAKSDITDSNERREDVHKRIASPDVAGHPTGGAVDVTIRNSITGEYFDMGCEISEFEKGNYSYYSENVTTMEGGNRGILQNCMVAVGFFPYYGEWWHFGYGDREWAFFYNKPFAIYSQKKREEVLS